MGLNHGYPKPMGYLKKEGLRPNPKAPKTILDHNSAYKLRTKTAELPKLRTFKVWAPTVVVFATRSGWDILLQLQFWSQREIQIQSQHQGSPLLLEKYLLLQLPHRVYFLILSFDFQNPTNIKTFNIQRHATYLSSHFFCFYKRRIKNLSCCQIS